jgi:P-type E1-E2 ATPase
MIKADIPGFGTLVLKYVVMDVNGTLTVDGTLIDGVPAALQRLREHLSLLLLTADTLGKQSLIDEALNTEATRITPGDEARKKAEFIRELGSNNVAAIGQGANDAGMLKEAGLGICVLSPEGTSLDALLNADIVIPDIISAFELLENPMRLKASLRK